MLDARDATVAPNDANRNVVLLSPFCALLLFAVATRFKAIDTENGVFNVDRHTAVDRSNVASAPKYSPGDFCFCKIDKKKLFGFGARWHPSMVSKKARAYVSGDNRQ